MQYDLKKLASFLDNTSQSLVILEKKHESSHGFERESWIIHKSEKTEQERTGLGRSDLNKSELDKTEFASRVFHKSLDSINYHHGKTDGCKLCQDYFTQNMCRCSNMNCNVILRKTDGNVKCQLCDLHMCWMCGQVIQNKKGQYIVRLCKLCADGYTVQ